MNNRVKELRNSLNMTQKKFANVIGINRTTLVRIEAGNINITNRNITAICKEFNVNEKWLLTGEGITFNILQLEISDPVEYQIKQRIIEHIRDVKDNEFLVILEMLLVHELKKGVYNE